MENFLAEKDAAHFQWSQDFDTRQWTLTFSFGGHTYVNSVGHLSLTDFKNDPATNSKLAALWQNKSKQDA